MDRVEFIVEPPDTYPGLPFNEYLHFKKEINDQKLFITIFTQLEVLKQ